MSSMRALVTGASGLLGQSLLAQEVPQNIIVRTTSRREPQQYSSSWMRADIQTGEGVEDVVRDIDVIVNAASSPRQSTIETDVDGTRRLLAAAKRAGVSHVVHISIIGIEKVPLAYYRAKVAAEHVVKEAGIPYTIVRGTQFHPFVRQLASAMLKGPFAFVPAGWLVQPIDVHEFAATVWRYASQPPCKCTVHVAGPEILEYTDVVRTMLAADSRKALVLPLPMPGRMSAALRSGALTDSTAKMGTVTWKEWCARRAGAARQVER